MNKVSYIREAIKEPLNVIGIVAAGAAAAGLWFFSSFESTLILAGSLFAEGAYLAVVPASSFYRRLVDQRTRKQLDAARRKQRDALIRTFDPREREAVEYLSWMKDQIASNFKKFARLQ